MQKPFSFPTVPLAFAVAFALNGSARAAEPEPTPAAKAHFKAGTEFYQAERWEDAYREFKAAYAITPRWTALGNIGIVADHLERDGEALDAFEDYLKRGGSRITAEEAASVRGDIERLRAGLAVVRLEARGPFWIVDTRNDANGSTINEYGPFEDRADLRVRAGQHEFKLDRSTIVASAWPATLLPGDKTSHAFEAENAIIESFEADQTEPRGQPERDTHAPRSHTASYVLWGAGAVGAAAATAFVLEANSIQSKGDQEYACRCPLGASPATGCEPITDASRRAAHWRTGALVTGMGALGALAGGTILYLFEGGADSTATPTQASLRPWVTPTGIGLDGTF